jgi:hypothetical protein
MLAQRSATMRAMEAPPAVWTVAPGADEDEVGELLDRLADHLGIETPEIMNGNVLLPADYPRVADALDDVQSDWGDMLIPPVA